ncbi:hypothetical protein [Actinomadura yumaensis]|uniref:Uncharacterized protein n=1 Tax=Actinomadura yumaensis TaxID=111807 RepID=A0ABW2CPB7_9ACTN
MSYSNGFRDEYVEEVAQQLLTRHVQDLDDHTVDTLAREIGDVDWYRETDLVQGVKAALEQGSISVTFTPKARPGILLKFSQD